MSTAALDITPTVREKFRNYKHSSSFREKSDADLLEYFLDSFEVIGCIVELGIRTEFLSNNDTNHTPTIPTVVPFPPSGQSVSCSVQTQRVQSARKSTPSSWGGIKPRKSTSTICTRSMGSNSSTEPMMKSPSNLSLLSLSSSRTPDNLQYTSFRNSLRVGCQPNETKPGSERKEPSRRKSIQNSSGASRPPPLAISPMVQVKTELIDVDGASETSISSSSACESSAPLVQQVDAHQTIDQWQGEKQINELSQQKQHINELPQNEMQANEQPQSEKQANEQQSGTSLGKSGQIPDTSDTPPPSVTALSQEPDVIVQSDPCALKDTFPAGDYEESLDDNSIKRTLNIRKSQSTEDIQNKARKLYEFRDEGRQTSPSPKSIAELLLDASNYKPSSTSERVKSNRQPGVLAKQMAARDHGYCLGSDRQLSGKPAAPNQIVESGRNSTFIVENYNNYMRFNNVIDHQKPFILTVNPAAKSTASIIAASQPITQMKKTALNSTPMPTRTMKQPTNDHPSIKRFASPLIGTSCPVCYQIFESKAEFQRHIKTVSTSKNYNPLTHQRIDNPNDDRFEPPDHENSVVMCLYCQLSFLNDNLLARHQTYCRVRLMQMSKQLLASTTNLSDEHNMKSKARTSATEEITQPISPTIRITNSTETHKKQSSESESVKESLKRKTDLFSMTCNTCNQKFCECLLTGSVRKNKLVSQKKPQNSYTKVSTKTDPLNFPFPFDLDATIPPDRKRVHKANNINSVEICCKRVVTSMQTKRNDGSNTSEASVCDDNHGSGTMEQPLQTIPSSLGSSKNDAAAKLSDKILTESPVICNSHMSENLLDATQGIFNSRITSEDDGIKKESLVKRTESSKLSDYQSLVNDTAHISMDIASTDKEPPIKSSEISESSKSSLLLAQLHAIAKENIVESTNLLTDDSDSATSQKDLVIVSEEEDRLKSVSSDVDKTFPPKITRRKSTLGMKILKNKYGKKTLENTGSALSLRGLPSTVRKDAKSKADDVLQIESGSEPGLIDDTDEECDLMEITDSIVNSISSSEKRKRPKSRSERKQSSNLKAFSLLFVDDIESDPETSFQTVDTDDELDTYDMSQFHPTDECSVGIEKILSDVDNIVLSHVSFHENQFGVRLGMRNIGKDDNFKSLSISSDSDDLAIEFDSDAECSLSDVDCNMNVGGKFQNFINKPDSPELIHSTIRSPEITAYQNQQSIRTSPGEVPHDYKFSEHHHNISRPLETSNNGQISHNLHISNIQEVAQEEEISRNHNKISEECKSMSSNSRSPSVAFSRRRRRYCAPCQIHFKNIGALTRHENKHHRLF